VASIQSIFLDALKSATTTAVHLEMRDSYGVVAEAEDFARWKSGAGRDMDPNSEYWGAFISLVTETIKRGVVMRRARIVSEPVSDYIRFEHAGTPVNISAGEEIRWLPRRLASDIALPGNDFWCFDGMVVIFNHFTGDGDWANPDMELRTESAVVKLCADAFNTVWERAIPHDDFRI
jgi:hypothetical protein